MSHRLIVGDCREVLAGLEPESIHSCVTDPPYDLTTAGRWGDAKTPPQEGTDGLFRRVAGGFLGQKWDAERVAFDPETWRAVLRVLKPGGWLAAMGSDRTHHRLMVAIEDAGFELRHCVCHCYASGFPKSLDVGKAVDRHLGAKREVVGRKADPRYLSPATSTSGAIMGNISPRKNAAETYERAGFVTAPATPEAAAWQGWGTAMKPAVEFVVLARAPLSESSVAANVLRHGTGGINIDACRVGYRDAEDFESAKGGDSGSARRAMDGWGLGVPIPQSEKITPAGRYPSTLWLSHGPLCSEEACGDGCPVAMLDAQAGERASGGSAASIGSGSGDPESADGRSYYSGLPSRSAPGFYDTGPASRFFPCFPYEPPPLIFEPKPSRRERDAGCEDLPDQTRNRVNPGGLENEPRWAPVQAKNIHPTVKSTALFRYICRLLTPPGGTVLDCFAGSGTTGVAAALEGFHSILIEREEQYAEIIRARVAYAEERADRGRPLLAKTRTLRPAPGQGSLFNPGDADED